MKARWTLAALAIVLAGCELPQSALMPRADQAVAIDRVWDVMLWACTGLYLAVLVALAWATWRRRDGQRREGVSRDDGIARGLVAWVVVILGFLTWFIALSFVQDRKLHAASADLDIRVTAHQWWWQVDYQDPEPSRSFTTANEIHLPVDRTVRIELRSGDVIHSFWVPALGGKEDLVPGRTNALWLTPREAGRFRGQCAEFCGLQHANMALDVVVREAAEFESWRVAQQSPARAPSSASAAAGARVFERSACATCHTIRGTLAGGRYGPDLTHVGGRLRIAAGTLPLARQHLLAWLADPQHVKPGNHMPAVRLPPEELEAVADYLLELR